MLLLKRFKSLSIVQSALVAIATGIFFTLVVPLQTFLANRDMFEFSSLATSNCRVAELVKKLESKDLKREDLDSILFAKKRCFLAKHGAKWWSFGRRLFFYEWVYDENGKLISYENRGIYKAN